MAETFSSREFKRLMDLRCPVGRECKSLESLQNALRSNWSDLELSIDSLESSLEAAEEVIKSRFGVNDDDPDESRH